MTRGLFCPVPSPELSILPSTSTVYAGSFLTINCSILLSSAVDSAVTVSAVWRRDDAVLTTVAHRRVLQPASMGGSLYRAQVVFNPVQLSVDDGQYSCEMVVNAGSEFVPETRYHSNTIPLHAAGIHKVAVRELHPYCLFMQLLL